MESPNAGMPCDSAPPNSSGVSAWPTPLRVQNAAFAQELSAHSVAHAYRLAYGGHNWALWRDNARPAYLAAATRLAHG